jgi:hypothetical protein
MAYMFTDKQLRSPEKETLNGDSRCVPYFNLTFFNSVLEFFIAANCNGINLEVSNVPIGGKNSVDSSQSR